ncbi:hypothetical protein L204_106126 [Cryptococcus depauperatus]
MLPATLLATVLSCLVGAQAASPHALQPPHLRHKRALINSRAQIPPRDNAAFADAKRAVKRTVKKRGTKCRARGTSFTPSATSVVPSATSTSSDSSQQPSSLGNDQAWAPHISSQPAAPSTDNGWSASTTSTWSQPSPPADNTNGGGNLGVLLTITDPTCGYSNADEHSPNGAEDWLNCGINNGGWTPPHVTVDQLITKDLSGDGIFAPCSAYIDKFNQYASQYGVKGIMLASFAMQESTCNPSATGKNGEAGLMQLTSDNCRGAPNEDCYNIDFNIQRGAELFSNLINANGGNVLLAFGAYNGWVKGLTVDAATAAAGQGRCAAQNNLDYLHQVCNGWLLGKSGYDLGSYFNLKSC